MKQILTILKTFLLLTAILTSIVVGVYAMLYAVVNALLYISIFLIGICGFIGGLYCLVTVSNKLK
jgi:hypothetical protein